jgi:hypothetical protein
MGTVISRPWLACHRINFVPFFQSRLKNPFKAGIEVVVPQIGNILLANTCQTKGYNATKLLMPQNFCLLTYEQVRKD